MTDVRAEALAQEIGVTCERLIEWLRKDGCTWIKRPDSIVSLAVANRVRRLLTDASVPDPQNAARDQPATGLPDVIEDNDAAQPPEDRWYLDLPFLSPTHSRIMLDWLSAETASPSQTKSVLPGKRELNAYDRLFLRPGRPTRDDVLQAQADADAWRRQGFTHGEVAAWLAAGLKPREAWLADMLFVEGIGVGQLDLPCQHMKTRVPATIVTIARRFGPQVWVYEPEISFSDYLDEWGVGRARRGRHRSSA